LRLTRPQSIAALVASGLLFALVFVSVSGSQPRACTLCHGEQVDALKASAHATVNCYDCHLEEGAWGMLGQKAREIVWMYPAALVGKTPSGPVIMISRDRCADCHEATLESGTVGRPIRITHSECAPGASCDPCHAQTSHEGAVRWSTGVVMEECVECHKASKATTKCGSCHSEETSGELRARGPWQVTHGPGWRETHGMGNLPTCSTCHPDGFCARCHGVDVPHPSDFGSTHGAIAEKDREACQTCHKDERLCDGCHQLEMPHPEEFVTGHREVAESTADARCFRCHVETDCDACHEMHVHPGGSKGVPVPWPLTDEGLRSGGAE